jgi:hypothetical protein
MKVKSNLKAILAIVLTVGMALAAHVNAKEFNVNKADVHDRMHYHRAIDAAVWAMPLMNFKFYRDALAGAGVGPNDIGYFSKLQNWKFQTATPNNTTPYIMTYWNLNDGPMVIELPPSSPDVGIFGTLMDAWQRPIDDVGALGRDKGKGATYLLVPPGYDGPLLPKALVYEQRTNNGFIVLRPIIKGATPENLAKATEFVKQIKIYPIAKAEKPPKMKFVDLYNIALEMTPVLNGNIYKEIHDMLEEEPVEDQNLVMMGLLARIGIRKGEPFEPSDELQSIYDKAAPEALQYMLEQYHRTLNPWFYEDRKWSSLTPSGDIETDWSYEFPSYFDYHARGALYYAIITSVKNYGSATFYLDLAETPDGQWLDGSKNYKLVMPPNVPVRNFWAVTTYDLETASYIRNVEKSSIDNTQKQLQKNADGSVDIYFGPKAPEGKESNWLPTDPKRRFFLLSRFYGPEPALFDKSFKLNDIELLK